MSHTESNPFNQLINNARLTGYERGIKDAECLLRFLGQTALDEPKNKIYNLSDPSQVEAHRALVEFMELPEPDFENVSDDPFEVEELGFEGRFVRQLISQNDANIVCYIASSEPLTTVKRR